MRGVTVYLYHDTLTPDNVRSSWDNALAVPRVGDLIVGHFGYEGAMATWAVQYVVWIGGVDGRSVSVHCTDAPVNVGPGGRITNKS